MNKDKIWIYFTYLIWTFFAFSIVYDLFWGIPSRSLLWVGELILAIILYYKLKVPKIVYLGIMLILIANILGELYFNFFYIFPYYDKVLHTLSPLLVCTLFYFLFENKFENKKMLIWFCVAVFLSWSLFWEVFEYFFTIIFNVYLVGVKLLGFQVMSGYEDTIYDMLASLVGSLAWASLALFLTRNKNKKPTKKVKN